MECQHQHTTIVSDRKPDHFKITCLDCLESWIERRPPAMRFDQDPNPDVKLQKGERFV